MVDEKKKNFEVVVETEKSIAPPVEQKIGDSNSTQRIESSLFKIDMTILIPAGNLWKTNPTVAEVFKLMQDVMKSDTHLNAEDFTIVKAMARRI